MLRFDNFTGDPSLDWIASTAPRILAGQLTGAAKTLPSLAGTVRDAYLAHASSIVHGYFDKRGAGLHFEIVVEDADRHKMTRTAAVDGEPLIAMNTVAKLIQPDARPFSTSNEQAVAAWGRDDDAQAVALDPGFGEAWLSWAQKLGAAADPSRALEAASHALMQPGLRSDIERTQIEALAASLLHDDAARAAALRKLTQLMPADVSSRVTLGELEMKARHFPEAVRYYREAVETEPGNPATENLLGYAEALAGNVDAARKAFEEYGRQPDQAINALDSLGEAYLMNGRFGEAEKAFLEAYGKAPTFLNGATLWKAAHARWLSGDLKGADALQERYWETRVKARDPLVVWRRANWLYETGRREQGIAMLMAAPPEAAEVARKQLVVWSDPHSIPQDVSTLKRLYEQMGPVNDGLARTFYAAALLRAGQKDEARKLVTRWPLPESGDNSLQALLYPEYLELRKALL